MKRTAVKTLSLMLVAGLVITTAGIASAAMKSAPSKDAAKLTSEIAMLNAEVSLPQGEKTISKELTDSFKVDSAKLNSLQAMNMQYGDIAAVLAFAEQMPDGVTDASINRVIAMHGTTPGWDQIAKNLDVKIGKVASKLNKIEEKTHKNIKQAYADSLVAGAAGGGVTGETGGDMSGGSSN